MSANSDPDYDRYADVDFTDAKRVHEVPALAKLQAEYAGKTRITIRVDDDVLDWFRREAGEGSYQTLINRALHDYIRQHDLEVLLRRVIREELHPA